MTFELTHEVKQEYFWANPENVKNDVAAQLANQLSELIDEHFYAAMEEARQISAKEAAEKLFAPKDPPEIAFI